jgi:hypothetical protein
LSEQSIPHDARTSVGAARDRIAEAVEQENVEERPFAKLSDRREYLQKVAGVSVSESTLSRALRGRWASAEKKDAGCE